MKNVREEIARWIQIAGIIAIWLVLIFIVQGNLAIDLEALRLIPEVVFVYALCHLAFTEWLWRSVPFRGWLVPFPDLQGTWTGVLKSAWVNPETGKSPDPIAVKLVIRQWFDRIAVTVYTAESSSISTAASFESEPNGQQLRLSYMYMNRPKPSVRERSAAHDGAATLRVVSETPMRLEGEYWTARQTIGEIEVGFRDNRLDGAFSTD